MRNKEDKVVVVVGAVGQPSASGVDGDCLAWPCITDSQEWLSLCQHLLVARRGCAESVEGDEGKIFL